MGGSRRTGTKAAYSSSEQFIYQLLFASISVQLSSFADFDLAGFYDEVVHVLCEINFRAMLMEST